MSIHAVQHIYELDSGKSKGFQSSHQTMRQFDYEEISSVLHEMAIIIPIKGEKLKLLEGVLSGIPNECLIIIVSNSLRSPVDRFALEVEAVRQLSRFMGKKIMVIHQKDTGLADIFKKLKYDSILDVHGNIRDGKAEGMVIGMLLSKMYHRDYVGFIDSDNYVPGAVNEYSKIFAAGFAMSQTPYCNVRVSWVFKPKVRDNLLRFAKWGRISEVTNKYLNSLISHITGFETDIIKTGNSGEHALSMLLAEQLKFSGGYSNETYELVNILEEFGGILPPDYPQVIEKGVEVFQIESRNPHFHEEKGDLHLAEMLNSSLSGIYHSRICPAELSRQLYNHIKSDKLTVSGNRTSIRSPKRRSTLPANPVMEPIKVISITQFSEEVRESSNTLSRFGGLK